MLPIQPQTDPRVTEARATKRELAASPAGAVVPQANEATCLQICEDKPTEASFRICMATCEDG